MSKEVIPYHRPYPFNEGELDIIRSRIMDSLKSGMLSNKKFVRKLEETVCELYDVNYCIATANCTLGLLLSIQFKKPHTIQMPGFNWWSDKYIMDFSNIEIWYNDIDENTWLSTDYYNHLQTIYVHTFGNIGESEGEDIIYDASHAFGGKLPEIGLATVFSLAPTKLITSCEGGLIITDDKEMGEWLTEKRDRMCRMSEPNAIVGLQTLDHLADILNWKETVFQYYRNNISGIFQTKEYEHTYNTIGFLNVNKLKIPEHIEYKQYYEPLEKGLPNTDYIYKNIICLPSWFGCPYEQIVEDIVEGNKCQ